MLIAVLVLQIISVVVLLGLLGMVSDLKPVSEHKPSLLDDDVDEPNWLADPKEPKEKRQKKTGLKRSTTLKKAQKRATNGRFA